MIQNFISEIKEENENEQKENNLLLSENKNNKKESINTESKNKKEEIK